MEGSLYIGGRWRPLWSKEAKESKSIAVTRTLVDPVKLFAPVRITCSVSPLPSASEPTYLPAVPNTLLYDLLLWPSLLILSFPCVCWSAGVPVTAIPCHTRDQGRQEVCFLKDPTPPTLSDSSRALSRTSSQRLALFLAALYATIAAALALALAT